MTSAVVPFGAWLEHMRAALRGDEDADVPCGTCTACCTASQFVTIGPDETDTLALVPAELLFPAPGQPPGHVVMGYDEQGRCPMLRPHGCSIYDHRPQACRMYDCRIYAATGVDPDDPGVADRVRTWRFQYASAAERAEHRALLSAADDVRREDRTVPNPTRVAVRALQRFGQVSDRPFGQEPDRDGGDLRP